MGTATPADLASAAGVLLPKIALRETEDSWETIFSGLKSLSDLFQNGASCEDPVELVRVVRSMSRPISSSMTSERTRLSGAAMDLINSVSATLGTSFEPLLPIFLPVLLSLCGRTNKVIITRARVCLKNIIETTQLPSILPYLLLHIRDKSMSIRLAAAEGTLLCMNCFNPPDLEKDTRARDIETLIRATARDSQAEVRLVSKKIFAAFKLLLPSRVQDFAAPLSPTMKKYLDIKASNPPGQSSGSLISGTDTKRPYPIPTGITQSRTDSREPFTRTQTSGQRVTVSGKPKTSQACQKTAAQDGPSTARPASTTTAGIPLRLNPPTTARIVGRPTIMEPRLGVPSTAGTQRLGMIATGPDTCAARLPSCAISAFPAAPQPIKGLSRSAHTSQKPQPGPRRVPVLDAQSKDMTTKTQQAHTTETSTNYVLSRPTRTDLGRSSSRHNSSGGISKKVPAVGASKSTKSPGGLHGPVKFKSAAQSTFSSRSRTHGTVVGRKQTSGQLGHKVLYKLSQQAAMKNNARHQLVLKPYEMRRNVETNQRPLHPIGPVISVADTPEYPVPLLDPPLAPTSASSAHHALPLANVEPPFTIDSECLRTPTPAANDNLVTLTEQALQASTSNSIEDDREAVAGSVFISDDQLLMRPATPRILFLSTPLDSRENTPISSLLSSIQRGFLLTPSVPADVVNL